MMMMMIEEESKRQTEGEMVVGVLAGEEKECQKERYGRPRGRELGGEKSGRGRE